MTTHVVRLKLFRLKAEGGPKSPIGISRKQEALDMDFIEKARIR